MNYIMTYIQGLLIRSESMFCSESGTLTAMNPSKYSFWLMPCSEPRETMEGIVGRLAARFGAPSFMPHVTLCSGVWKQSEAELVAEFGKVGQALRSRRLFMNVSGIDWTDHWATFFFLRLSGAGDVFERAAALVEGSHSPEAGPHLSLLYGVNVLQIDRTALRQELAGQLPEELFFDSLALVRPVTGRWEDINRWETFCSVPLTE